MHLKKKILTGNLEHILSVSEGTFCAETRPIRLHDDNNVFNNTLRDGRQEREYSDEVKKKTSIGNINRSK